jgi:lipid-A-disaccharide synthase
MSSPVGILAGGGGLPLEAADAIRRSGRSVHVVAIAGEADPAIAGLPHTWVNWGGIGAMLRAFRDAECTEIVIIGGVRRPDLVKVRPDAGFFLSLPLLLRLMSGGDDSVLRRVVQFFERKGFKVRGVHEVAPALLAAAGPLAGQPSEADWRDIKVGLAMIEALGPADVGQAVVVASGRPIAIEAAEGTDGILQRVGDLRRRGQAGNGGVLVKAAKPGQELRVDLPVIGPKTVEHAASAGLAGIAVVAGAVLLAERHLVHAAAERRGLFLFGAEPTAADRRRAGDLVADRLENAGLSRPRPLGSIRCRAREWRDVRQGLAVVAGAAAFGAGAAAVVARGHVLAVEAGEGPQAVVERAGHLRQWGDARSARRRRGVLILRSAADLSRPLMDKAAAAGLAVIALADSAADPARLSALGAAGDRMGLCVLGAGSREGVADRLSTCGEPAPGRLDSRKQPLGNVAGVNQRELRIFLVAGEHSGDALGAKLMAAIKACSPCRVDFAGVGGDLMAAQGLVSPFPLSDVAIMGPLSILPRLPRILRRVYSTVDAAVAAEPDAVVIIDSPEFTHPIAKRIKKRKPSIPVIDYVSPQLWAWRPGRAKKMRAYVDHVLALLPFEPEAHARLGGPPCSYVGHPLIERLGWVRALDPAPLAERLKLDRSKPVLVVLPGSRTSEVSRLMQPFGEAITQLRERGLQPEVVIPTVPHLRGQIEQALAAWQVSARLVHGDEDKFRAFKLARAALAASGTVTLELGLVGTPMVVAYRVDAVAARLRFLVKVPSVVLANLVLGENVFPEFIQEACVPESLADAVAPLLADTPERERQLAGLACIPERLQLAAGSPSEAAAEIVLGLAGEGRTGIRR